MAWPAEAAVRPGGRGVGEDSLANFTHLLHPKIIIVKRKMQKLALSLLKRLSGNERAAKINRKL